jgi:signal transduction histidine kinase
MAQPDGAWPAPQTVDLTEWVPDHLRRWSAHPREADFGVEVDAAPPLPVRVHPPLLGQLLDTLLEYACKYCVVGTPIVVRVRRDGPSALVGVEDRGCGIAEEDASRVFEPFFRTERARHEGQPGVGLGLAVAARIAETFGGSLDLRSAPGAGSLFLLRLLEAPDLGPRPESAGSPLLAVENSGVPRPV